MGAFADRIDAVQLAFTAAKAAACTGVLLTAVAYVIVAERRICAFVQDRLGPNRAGPFGLLQPACDGVKALLKEDFTPGHVRRVLFTLAPILAMLPALLTLAVIPFGSRLGPEQMVVADLNVGVLYILAMGLLGVYSILLAGYASRSKYPLLGGLRGAAQLISYEVVLALSLVPVLMYAGSLGLGPIVNAQAGTQSWFGGLIRVPNWFLFRSPMTFLAIVLFVVALCAELNRAPFDFPEAEQELAGGYNVEYSSMRFAMFFLGEYANMIVGSAVVVTLFLGGWTLPVLGLDRPATTLAAGLAQIGVFMAKVALCVLALIWVRWMWPRFRFDQLMRISWERLLPLAALNIVATAFWLALQSGN